MNRFLRLNDKLFDVALNRVTMVVTSAELIASHIRVVDLERSVEQIMPYEKLRERIGDGTLRIQREGSPRIAASQAQSEALDRATARALEVVREVKNYASSTGVSRHKAYQDLRNDNDAALVRGDAAVQPFPSPSTVYRYLYRDKNDMPVLRAEGNKGNRTPRYKPRVVDLIKTVCKRELLKPDSRWTVRDTTKACNQALHDDGFLPRNTKVSTKYVRAVIYKQLSTDPDFERTDPKLRAAKKSVAKGRLRVDGLLQRVEQDALHLPWSLRTGFGDARNIYIVHAICCGSSVPLGFHLVVGSPRESDGFRCVETYLFSKKNWFAELGIPNGPDLYGTPVTLVFDNGAEAKGERMTRVTQIGIAPVYLPSRNPQKKPFIERLNRSVKEALQTLPGCTRFDDEDGMRDPALLADLPMPLEEFKRWLARFFFEDWVNRPLQRFVSSVFVDDRELGNTPRERFENMARRDGYAYPLPPNPFKWRMLKYLHEQRVLSRKSGISINDFRFRGDNLPRLIKRFGETLVTVLVDPDDFRTVWVLDGEELIPLTNIDTDETTPAYTYQEAKAMLKEAALQGDEREEVENFRRDLFARSALKSAKQVKADSMGAAEESKSVAQQSRRNEAVQRARDNPTPTPAPQRPPNGSTGLSDVGALPVYNRDTGAAL
jgi:putative transposase